MNAKSGTKRTVLMPTQKKLAQNEPIILARFEPKSLAQ
jgi:hypothetical protein